MQQKKTYIFHFYPQSNHSPDGLIVRLQVVMTNRRVDTMNLRIIRQKVRILSTSTEMAPKFPQLITGIPDKYYDTLASS